MPNYCCVPGCSTRNGLLFPTDTALQLKRRVALKSANKNGTLWMPNLSNDIVCHSHFKADDYSKTKTKTKGRFLLKIEEEIKGKLKYVPSQVLVKE